MTNNLKSGERIDDLQCKGYTIIQNPEMFCFGMDAVLLANFIICKKTSNVLDLGTGTGIIPILMEGKDKGSQFTGLEIQQASADMARRSVELNNLQDKINIINGDIKEVSSLFKEASFDVVTSNPPYINQSNGLLSETEPKNIARHEILLTLEDVIKGAAYALRVNGIFAMVHKPFRLGEIFALMNKYNIEPKRMQMVQPKANKEPNMVLIQGIKGAKPMIKIDPTLVVYKENGERTKELLDYYEGKVVRAK